MGAKTTTATATPSTTATTSLRLTGTLVRPHPLSLCTLSAFALGLALCLRSPTISRTASTGGTVLRHARTVRPHRDRSGPYGAIVDVSILMAAATVP